MSLILDEIVAHKKIEVAAVRALRPFDHLKEQVAALKPREAQFARALESARGMGVIAEIKKKSPSKGILRADFDPIVIAGQYEKGGAAALSVLTDEKFFAGSAEILRSVRSVTKLPILRKDFTIDPYQIFEARLIGADAVLLIASILSPDQLKEFRDIAESVQLDALFEVHDEKDLEKVMPLEPRLLGINNRDLKTFSVDLAVTTRLMRKIPKGGPLVISESGIQTAKDLDLLSLQGVKAVLVGESLMKEADPGEALRRLVGYTNSQPSRGMSARNAQRPKPGGKPRFKPFK